MIRSLAVCLLLLSGFLTAPVRADTGVDQQHTPHTFKQVFNSHAAVMLLIDPATGAIEAANQAAENFYGYPVERLSSMSIDQINRFDAHQVAAERMLASDQQRSFFRFRHELADGSIAPVNVYSTPVGEDGLLLSVIHPVQVGAMYQTELEHYQQQLELQLDDRLAALKQARLWQVGGLGVALLMLSGLLVVLLRILQRLRRSEQAFRREHGFLQAMLDAPAGFAVIAIDHDGVIDFYNHEAERLLGYPRDEVVGKRTALLFHRESDLNAWFSEHTGLKDTRQARRTFWGQLAKLGSDRSYWTLMNAEDRPVEVALVSTELPADGGHSPGWLVVIEPLQREEKKEATVFNPCRISEMAANIAGIGAWSLEMSTGQMRWNATCYGLLGFDEKLIQSSYSFFRQAVHPADRSEVEAAIEQAMVWGDALDCEFRVVDDHGRMRWLHAQAEPVAGQDGRTDWLVGSLWDVTGERNVREQLREREQLFRALYEQSPVSVMIHDPETGQCLDANQTALDAYGLHSLDQLLQPEAWLDSPYSLADAQEAIRKAGTYGICEVEWASRNTDGSIFYEWVYLHPIELDQGRRVISIGIDITGRLDAERALEHKADQLRERVRELHCLHQLAEIAKEPLSIDVLLDRAVALLPLGMQHHARAIASIDYAGVQVGDESAFTQTSRIDTPLVESGKKVGKVAIAYLEPDEVLDSETVQLRFLPEERQLLKTFAEQLMVALRQRAVALQAAMFERWQTQTRTPMLLIDDRGQLLQANQAAQEQMEMNTSESMPAEKRLGRVFLQHREAISRAIEQSGYWQGEFDSLGAVLVVAFAAGARKKQWLLSIERGS